MGILKTLSISQIKANPVALRSVDRQGESYLGLKDSIQSKGFLGTITVREREEGVYEIVDGLHRFTAVCDLGLSAINVDVVSLDDDQVLEAQLMTNIHRVETKPVEYSNQLRRILTRNPLMTEAELATKLGKGAAWIKDRLGLTKISNPNAVALIDDGKIGLSNAYALALLPAEEQADFLDRAITMDPAEFIPTVKARVKEIKDAGRQGKDAAPAEFVPVAHLQKLTDIKTVGDNPTAIRKLIASNNVSTTEDAFALAIKWVLQLDPESIARQKAKDDARRAESADAKKRRDEERAAKKVADAKAAAASLI